LRSSTQLISDFQNIFTNKKANVNIDSIFPTNPLRFSVDWSTYYSSLFFNEENYIFNVIDDLSDETSVKTQILFTINDSDTIIRSLVYIFDDEYYTQQMFSPRMINFTGTVLEFTINDRVETEYVFNSGIVENVEVYDLISRNIKWPSWWPWGDGCYDFGTSWWERFCSAASGGGGTPGKTSLSYYYLHGPRGPQSYFPNGNWSISGGGGGGYVSCNDQGAIWQSHDIDTKRNFYKALSNTLDVLNMYICNDPFTTESSHTCLYVGGDFLCDVSDCISESMTESEMFDCLIGFISGDSPDTEESVISKYLTDLDLGDEYSLIISHCVNTLDGPNGLMDIYIDKECAEEAIIEEIIEKGFDSKFPGTNECEDALIGLFPDAALKIYGNSFGLGYESANYVTETNFGWNDCTDAFRHAFFNALNAQEVGEELALLFSDAHECDPSPDRLKEREMDLLNNRVGIDIGSNNPTATDDEIKELVCSELEFGNLTILNDPNNGNSNLLDSDGCECN